MRRKPCTEIENEFDVWIWKVHSLSVPSDYQNCSKIQEPENRRDLYTPALGPFNYHIKGKSLSIFNQPYPIDFHPTDFWSFKTTPINDVN